MCTIQDRLDAQKKEQESNPDYNKSFKAQATKEERKAKRSEIVATIGALRSIFISSFSCRAAASKGICF